jgi:hypothetical protein
VSQYPYRPADLIQELFDAMAARGVRFTFDLRRDWTLCAVCGRREWRGANRVFFTDRPLPWLGECRAACSERCEWEAIGMRDGVGDGD